MQPIRNIIAALLAASAFHAGAVELTDMWHQPAEPGWGANIVHQNEIAFVTLFIYGANGEAQWYSSDVRTTGYLGASGLPQLSGTLYRTRGPRLGVPFDSNDVRIVPVGMLYLSPRSLNAIDLEYTIDGLQIKTTVERLTWRQDFHSEGYAASFAGRRIDSASRRQSTFSYAGGAFLEIEGGFARLRMQQGNVWCDYRGAHQPSGRIAAVVGGFECNDGRSGAFELTDLTVTDYGFNGRLKTVNGNVTELGALGGGRNPIYRM